MKIVHTEASCGWGGQEIRILEESKGMIGRGHEILVLCPPESRIYVEAARWGVPVEALSIGRKSFKGFLALRRWLRSHRLDVLNTHSSTDSWLAALACTTLSSAAPIVRTRHISAPIPDNVPTRWLYTKATQFIVTTGEKLRRELIERNGFPAEMIASIPTGIDPGRFFPGDKKATRRALGLDPDSNYIGIIATLRSWKGHSHLLEAFSRLDRENWQLAIIGDGPQRGALAAQVQTLGITDKVNFAGHCNNPEDWLRALDIFCLPSYANEGVPQSLVQATLTALPIVTTPVGSITEVVTHDESALIVKPKNPLALVNALQTLIDEPDRARALGLAARAAALRNSTLEAMLDRMEAVFYKVAK